MAEAPKDQTARLAKLTVSDEVEHVSGNSDAKERPAHWFKPGQSGNPAGKPKGARHKLSNDFVKVLAEDFAKHGQAAIVTVREEDPGKYLDIIAKLVPKDIEVNMNASDAFVKMWETVAAGTFNAMAEDIEQAEQRVN